MNINPYLNRASMLDRLIIKTHINGIPCHVRVDYYQPGRPDKVSGLMEQAEEGYDEEFEYTILDHQFGLATWITKQIALADEARLLDEFHCTLLEHKHYLDEWGFA